MHSRTVLSLVRLLERGMLFADMYLPVVSGETEGDDSTSAGSNNEIKESSDIDQIIKLFL